LAVIGWCGHAFPKASPAILFRGLWLSSLIFGPAIVSIPLNSQELMIPAGVPTFSRPELFGPVQ
jgi:hypothetical protein